MDVIARYNVYYKDRLVGVLTVKNEDVVFEMDNTDKDIINGGWEYCGMYVSFNRFSNQRRFENLIGDYEDAVIYPDGVPAVTIGEVYAKYHEEELIGG